jgi:hypothetical protein
MYDCVCLCKLQRNKVASYTTAQTNLIYVFIYRWMWRAAHILRAFRAVLRCGQFAFPSSQTDLVSPHPMKSKRRKKKKKRRRKIHDTGNWKIRVQNFNSDFARKVLWKRAKTDKHKTKFRAVTNHVLRNTTHIDG